MKIRTVFAGLLAAFLVSACDWVGAGGLNSFDYNLRGTWVSNDPGIYSGTVVIDYNTITITGYSENQTPLLGDDNKRPFRNFVKGIPLKGYSDSADGKIFIEKNGILQEGIPYTYWENSSLLTKTKLLTLTFGGRDEILQPK